MTADEFVAEIGRLVVSEQHAEALELARTPDTEIDGSLTPEQYEAAGSLLEISANIVAYDARASV